MVQHGSLREPGEGGSAPRQEANIADLPARKSGRVTFLGEQRTTRLRDALVFPAAAASSLFPAARAVAQTPPSAPAPPKQQNAIVSGSATLPSADAADERAAKKMAEAALIFWAALTLPRNVAGNLSSLDDPLIRRDRGRQPAARTPCSTAPESLAILGF